MSDSPFNFAPLGDQRDHHEHYTAGQRLNVEIGRLRSENDAMRNMFADAIVAHHDDRAEIGRLRQRESMLEAQIEVLELTIGKLRCVCDAAFTLVREDCGSDDCTDDGEGARSAWQELVSALEDIGYQPVDNPDA